MASRNNDTASATAWISAIDADSRDRIAMSWDAALAADGDFAADFYDRVFAADPAAIALFPGDMMEQRKLLTRTMSSAISLIGEPEDLLLLLRASGARHAHYGVRPSQFAVIGTALIATVADRADAAFTPEVANAWKAFYAAIATIMRDSMQQAKRTALT